MWNLEEFIDNLKIIVTRNKDKSSIIENPIIYQQLKWKWNFNQKNSNIRRRKGKISWWKIIFWPRIGCYQKSNGWKYAEKSINFGWV